MEWLIRTGKESWQNRAMARQQKITFGEMRSSAGPIRPIVYCGECAHSVLVDVVVLRTTL